MKSQPNRSFWHSYILGSPRKRILDPPTSFGDVLEGISLQIGRKYLFVDLYKKALVYLLAAFLVSLVADNIRFPNNWYLAEVNHGSLFHNHYLQR